MAQMLLFAAARQAAGTSRAEFAGGTLAEVLDRAVAEFGEKFRSVLSVSSVMLRGELVSPSDYTSIPVEPGDELAVLPPVSGGSVEKVARPPVRVAILTVSDRASRGEYVDKTGPATEMRLLAESGFEVVEREILADDAEAIADLLRWWCDQGGVDVVLTNGGTGLAARDVTPDATLRVIEREVPGLGELMRSEGRNSTPMATLSRQVAGQRGRTLVINLPGSPSGAVESLDAVIDLLGHAVAVMQS